LLKLDALAELSEVLPEHSIEYNKGDLPIGISPEDVPSNGLTIGDTIRRIDKTQSWAVRKNIEQKPAYKDLLLNLLSELKPIIEAKTGEMLTPQGFIFVSSPGSMTPYHFDPEHNILLQLRGEKWMTQYPAGNERFAPLQAHENYHTGGPRELHWQSEFEQEGVEFHLTPGEALFVPVMAPHFVRNGQEPSISLSITWRSEWSYAEADSHAFNHWLRKAGVKPRSPGRYPAQNLIKSRSWRALLKMGIGS